MAELAEAGVETVAVIGGADTFTAFAHHTDEWHLTVCPLWVGESGVPLGHELGLTKFEVVSRELWESGEVLMIGRKRND